MHLQKAFFLLLMFSSAAISQQSSSAELAFTSSAQEQRYHDLIVELRCVVCQNQSLAESNVELAQKLRAEVKKQILAGASDEEIKQYLVDRYGEFVLYKPRLGGKNALLWLFPLTLILVAGLVLWRIRSRSRQAEPAVLSPEEQARVERLVKGGE